MWRRKETELDRQTVDGIILMLMQIDGKLDDVLVLLREEEDDEPQDDA